VGKAGPSPCVICLVGQHKQLGWVGRNGKAILLTNRVSYGLARVHHGSNIASHGAQIDSQPLE
jgi:hypothetical protein